MKEDPITYFDHVRVIKLIDQKYLVCLCGRPHQKGGPCAHMYLVLQTDSPVCHHIRKSTAYSYYYGRINEFLHLHASLGELDKNWDSLIDGYIPVPFAEDHFKGIIEEPSSYPSAINGVDDNDLERCRWILRRNSAGHPVEAGQQHSSIEPSVGHEDIEQTMFGGALSMTTHLTELAGGEDDSHDFMDEQIELTMKMLDPAILPLRPNYVRVSSQLLYAIGKLRNILIHP